MNTPAKKPLVLATLGFCLTVVAGSAYAQVCDPKDPKCVPPPKTTADCSPGFYKNHPETWCNVTCPTTGSVEFTGAECDVLIEQLGARGPGSAGIRSFAKQQIDACFGTASASPCTDD